MDADAIHPDERLPVGEPEITEPMSFYLQRADSLSKEFSELAVGITQGASTRYEKVEAVLGFLSRDFEYTLEQLRSQRVEKGAR